MEHGKFYKATEIARIYGIPAETVRNLCHARGQKFATRLTPNGRFYIDLKKFEEFLQRKQQITI
ncbi:MAG: helix-turn-helix domain-containing protein [Lachnospiraceae bacterium]|nr:helix-turn-helix domain-containing protein [Lachnospiraceae bacterium]